MFHVCTLSAKSTAAEPPPAQRKGVLPWPFPLTAGGDVCLAMAAVGSVSQRISVFYKGGQESLAQA